MKVIIRLNKRHFRQVGNLSSNLHASFKSGITDITTLNRKRHTHFIIENIRNSF